MGMISKAPIDDSSPGIWAAGVSEGKWQMARHLIPLDEALTRASFEPNQRIICMMPPRSGKSMLCSNYFPAWYRRKFPRRNIMLWSATGRLAQRFSTNVRDIAQMPLDDRTHSWERWKVLGTGPNEGEFYAAGVGGGATMGAGAHCLIVDDFFKDVESALSEVMRQKLQEWYLTSCLTRMEPGASIVLIATRWHRDDLIGFVLQQARELGEHWDVIKMKAIDDAGRPLWPERFPIPELERIRKRYLLSGYPWMWEALYQQEPPEVLDSEWDPSYFGPHIMFDEWPSPERTRFKLITLDPSVGAGEKTDYSAIVLFVVDTTGHIWIDADLRRRDAEVQVDDVLRVSREAQVNVIGVETNGFQGVLRGMFRRRCSELGVYPAFHGISTRVDKRMKIRAAITPYLARGMLHFRKHSPGVSLTLEQLRGFPTHKYDDGPDALAMAIELAQHITQFGVEDEQQGELIEVVSC